MTDMRDRVRAIGSTRAARRPSVAVKSTVRWSAAGIATALALFAAQGIASENEESRMDYPPTEKQNVVDVLFGAAIPDPFRWLEGDIRRDPDVALWVDAQNGVSAPYLAELPGRAVFHDRLTAHYDHERVMMPEKRGARYFFTRNSGLEAQPVLFVRDGVNGTDRVLIDPNQWSPDGTTALAEMAPSEDGTHLAFAVQESGADWRTIRVMDVESNSILEDEVRWARFTTIAWAGDGSGFFYGRNSEPVADAGAPLTDHAVYFHRLGTPQADDRLVHAPESEVPLFHTVETTRDGRYLLIYSSALSGGNSVSVADLSTSDWSVRSLVETVDKSWALAGNRGSTLYFTTQEGADRGKIVAIDLDASDPRPTDLVAEQPDAVLRVASLVGDRLIASYMRDAKSEVVRFHLDGSDDGTVPLPGIGSVSDFVGRPGDDEAFFLFTNHVTPMSVHRYDVASNTLSVWAQPNTPIDPDTISVEQHFYSSLDGTRVPIFVVRRRDVTGPAPTMLTAYGGFGISMIPFYSPDAMAWVEQGGVYAVANIRGGGEYGKGWHDDGRLARKQNGYDDFIAAAEFLMAERIAKRDGLAIHGESNGGLLVGAVVNQRPDLFAAALPGVGVLDMLRFGEFTGGPYWTQEYGDPLVEAAFRNIVAYSPLHNLTEGEEYPAILVTTADTDDRVVPAHSFKYAATLQSADIGDRPHLLRTETSAGHGAGKPTDKIIDEVADRWAFAAHWTGLEVRTQR